MKKQFSVDGMTCSACQAKIETTVKKQKGIASVSVSLINKTMVVDYDEKLISEAAIAKSVAKSGYRLNPRSEDAGSAADAATRRLNMQKRQLVASIVFLFALFYFSMGEMLGLRPPAFLAGNENIVYLALVQLVLVLPIAVANRRFFQSGFKSLFQLAPNMDSLVAIGASAAFIYSFITLFTGIAGHTETMANHLFFEAAGAILTFVAVGKYLEEKSKLKTTTAIRRLMDLSPKTTLVEKAGMIVEIETKDLIVGDIVLIKPGMAIPVDGTILSGESDIDEALVTGEAMPVYKKTGDNVISGTINKTGSFRFLAEKVGLETTLSQIIALVEQTTMQKIPIQKFADKLSGIFVPVVLAIALVTFSVWLLVGQPLAFALGNAIAVLVISCPCALGLATPVAITVATGMGAEVGILLKNPETLEHVHKLTTIVFDKTGTITFGKPEVTDIINIKFQNEDELMAHAYALEELSEHPLARAIVAKVRPGLSIPEADAFLSIPGKGVRAVIAGDQYHMGNQRLMAEEMVDVVHHATVIDKLNSEGKTAIMIARNKELLAIIALIDEIKPTSFPALANLKKRQLKLVMLTGDNRRNADIVKNRLGIDQVISEVTPAEKSRYIASLQEAGESVAMVGDGVNDAIALTKADVGIAIGAGSDIAIASCDIVLMRNDLNDVASSLTLSEKTMATIKTNLFWAFIYNLLGIPIAAGLLYPFFGVTLDPMFAALAMSLSSISVVLNALRLKHTFRKEGAST